MAKEFMDQLYIVLPRVARKAFLDLLPDLQINHGWVEGEEVSYPLLKRASYFEGKDVRYLKVVHQDGVSYPDGVQKGPIGFFQTKRQASLKKGETFEGFHPEIIKAFSAAIQSGYWVAYYFDSQHTIPTGKTLPAPIEIPFEETKKDPSLFPIDRLVILTGEGQY